MKNTIKKPSWFDSALSGAVSDFAKEMGYKPISKITSEKPGTSPGANRQELDHSSAQKTNKDKLVTQR